MTARSFLDVCHINGTVNSLFFSTGKYVFASLVCSFRHGREEDEVMGVSFSKELVVDRCQIYPTTPEMEKNKMQVQKYQISGSQQKIIF